MDDSIKVTTEELLKEQIEAYIEMGDTFTGTISSIASEKDSYLTIRFDKSTTVWCRTFYLLKQHGYEFESLGFKDNEMEMIFRKEQDI